jgi:hypothetical protein
MSKITMPFGDSDHDFKLTIGGLKELQEKLSVGPLALFNRLISGEWKVEDAREIIRVAAIGGGMSPVDALVLVKRYCDDRPLLESIEPALKIMSAALSGTTKEQEDSPPKKPETPVETLETSALESSSPPAQ